MFLPFVVKRMKQVNGCRQRIKSGLLLCHLGRFWRNRKWNCKVELFYVALCFAWVIYWLRFCACGSWCEGKLGEGKRENHFMKIFTKSQLKALTADALKDTPYRVTTEEATVYSIYLSGAWLINVMICWTRDSVAYCYVRSSSHVSELALHMNKPSYIFQITLGTIFGAIWVNETKAKACYGCPNN